MYTHKKQWHALASLRELTGYDPQHAAAAETVQLLQQAVDTRQWMLNGIESSRSKDYDNNFRKMMYDSQEEMDEVLGSYADNSFIKKEQAEFENFRLRVAAIQARL